MSTTDEFGNKVSEPLPKLGDDLDSFVVLELAHLLNDGDDRGARELVAMAAKRIEDLESALATARDKALYDAIDVIRRTDRKMRRANYLCDASKCIEALQALRAAGEKKT